MKQRLISSIIILVIIIPIIINGGIIFNLSTLLIGMLSLKELMDIRKTKKEFPFLVQLIAYLLFTLLILNNINSNILIVNLDYKIISSIIFGLLIPLLIYKDNKKYNINDVMFLIGCIFFLGLAFNLIILIRNYNIMCLVFLLLITMMSDTFAYVTGYYVGKTPLLKEFSPKKTWEGLIGGTFFGVLISSLFFLSVINNNVDTITLVSIATFLSILGQMGDLIFSSIKRYFGQKDFSNLIPGHGGILDRLDSILFVVLAFALIISFINI